MNANPNRAGRDGRVASLTAVQSTLTAKPGKPEDVLAIAGDLLRRSGAVGTDLGVVDRALQALSPAEVSKYLETLDVAELEHQLQRASDEAVEAGLAETAEEREMWASSALDALFARDRAESPTVALERYPAAD